MVGHEMQRAAPYWRQVRKGRRRLLVLIALAAMLLGGCGTRADDDEPTPAPTETTTPAPAPSTDEPTGPTEEPPPEPTPPPEMDRDDLEGAKAAAVFFVELYTYVYVTGDVQAWADISHPECQFCAGVVDRVASVHSDGGYADGPVVDIVEIVAEPPDEEYEYFSVWLDVIERPSSRFNVAGEAIDTSEGGPNEFDLALAHVADEWQVRGAVVRAATEGGAE